MNKKAVVIHSGGMDSSLCLAVAIKEFGNNNVLSLSFKYGQRHSLELERASAICKEWQVEHVELPIDCLQKITCNALMDKNAEIAYNSNGEPNTLVTGRNGLMARLGSIHADHLGAHCIYMGVIEVESANSGYRDCTRHYMDLMQEIMRIDLGNPQFEIRTPLIKMTKKQTMELGHSLGVLDYLLIQTVTCYRGIPELGCENCFACQLRNEGLAEFLNEHPTIVPPYTKKSL
ncbi:MAG: 7-cyano-7-deazaguanine synthase QueC [Gammaproteobacteria bacterium RIFCSPHIGHO2_12_FULL_41_15]|nr:MAG: 7-cyano-7-deazaguanine synthase QueC [Gammaproteobacteria bacterium RIFCSPHIGHO2_12_FULL_41_15]